MKITRTNSINKNYKSPSKVNRKAKDFSSEFNFTNEKETKQHLKKLLKKINKKGKHIISTNSIRTVEEYKLMIQEYLTLIIQSGYKMKKIESPWKGQQLTIVEILDHELEELSQLVLEQKDTLAIIQKLDCISGLLIDSYK